jgi:hypothetical protein
MKKYLLVKSLGALVLGLLLTASVAQAQSPGSGGPTPGATPPDPTQVPIDGGASLLLAGGVAYGLKRLRARRQAR